MNKREFLKTSFLGTTGIVLGSTGGLGSTGITDRPFNSSGSFPINGEFVQNPLGYAYNALEPVIDAQTMEIHYSKHHAAYTKNLNAALPGTDAVGKSIEQILAQISKYPIAIRNNGGGFYNHNLFWDILTPGGSKSPQGKVLDAIVQTFGSYEKFKEEFTKKSMSVFGSGWAWLINNNGSLKITSTANQDCPLMDVAEEKGIPLIGLDVWEHAYYLKYQNRRKEYVDNFFQIINWDKVQARY